MELSNDLKEQIRKEAEKEYPRNQVAQMAFMYGCASYAIHKQKAEAYEKALREIKDIVLRYHKENGDSPAANHCRNIAMEAIEQNK